jgi:Fe-S-cluster containining protein
MPSQEPLPANCTECGACCYGDGPKYVRVTGSDYSRLGERAVGVTHFEGNRCYMRLVERRCSALDGSFRERRCSCSLYDSRPEPCRALEHGSAECRAVLERERSRLAT